MATTSGGQQEHCTDPREEGNTEICEQIQRHISETGQYGGKPERPTGSVLIPRRGQNICLPSIRYDTRDTTEPVVQENAEGLRSRRHPDTLLPRTHVLTPQEYLNNFTAGTMPQMNNHKMLKEMAEKAAMNDQTQFVMMEFHDLEHPQPSKTPGPQKCK